jgi:hypothetical protein
MGSSWQVHQILLLIQIDSGDLSGGTETLRRQIVKAFNTLVTAVANSGSASGYLDLDLSTVVPAGKQLVVEFVSTSSEMPSGQKPDPVIVILNNAGSAVVQHYLVTHFQLNYSGADIHKSADPVRMHLPRNLTLRVALARDGTTGVARCFFGISGCIEAA